jgi:hypothetical protein
MLRIPAIDYLAKVLALSPTTWLLPGIRGHRSQGFRDAIIAKAISEKKATILKNHYLPPASETAWVIIFW